MARLIAIALSQASMSSSDAMLMLWFLAGLPKSTVTRSTCFQTDVRFSNVTSTSPR